MHKRAFALGLLVLSVSAQAQKSIQQYVTQTLQVIDSVDSSTTGYDDLKAIGAAIGDARVVMLGESDHGDAPTFLAKSRIIKYLVEEKGFDVVAFESDFFSLNYNSEGVSLQQKTALAHLHSNVAGVWSCATECQPLFKYLAAGMAARKISVAGFDCHHQSRFSQSQLYPLLLQFLDSSHILPKGSQDQIVFSQQWEAYLKYFKSASKAPDSIWHPVEASLKYFHQQAREKYGPAHFWVQQLENLLAYGRQYAIYETSVKGRRRGFAIRDEQMASNLKWLATHKYPDSKIIVWAANGHINRQHIYSKLWFGNSIHVMGGYFTRDPHFDRTTYVLGFTALQGKHGRLRTMHFDIKPPKKKSFESWAASRAVDYGFVDFKKYKTLYPRRHKKFCMKANSYHNVRADWMHMFDGVFYIKDMYPPQLAVAVWNTLF